MKNIFKYFLLLCAVGWSSVGWGQINGPSRVCRGGTYTYTLTDADYSPSWNINGGTILSGNFSSSISVKVNNNATSFSLSTYDKYNHFQILNINSVDYVDIWIPYPNINITSGQTASLTGSATGSSWASETIKWTCNKSACAFMFGDNYNQVTANPLVSTIYTFKSTMDFGGGLVCSNTGTVNVTVSAVPLSGNTISYSGTNLCGSGTPSQIVSNGTLSGGTTPYSYQWQSSLNNSTWTNISGATSLNYTPSTSISQTTYYRRLVNPGTSQSVSNVITVVVMPNSITQSTTNFVSNTTIKAVQTVVINGNLTASSNVAAKFKAGDSITVNTSSSLGTGIELSIEGCNNGARIATFSEDTDLSEFSTLQSPFPNPISSGYLNFGKFANEYMLYNSLGKVVKEGTNAEGFEVDNLEKGIYLLKLDGVVNKISIN